MSNGARALGVITAALVLGGCVTAPDFPRQGEFGPEQSFTGDLRLGFERQSFDQCWLDLANTAWADLGRLAPSPALADQRAVYAARVTLVGRRRNMINGDFEGTVGLGFGHLGMYPCLVQATRITAAQLR